MSTKGINFCHSIGGFYTISWLTGSRRPLLLFARLLFLAKKEGIPKMVRRLGVVIPLLPTTAAM